MPSNNSINLVSLDFDTLKNSLVTFLQSQPQFQDYNFAGSNISVLLDLLSYNTYLNAFYLNMVGSEMFLDSAQMLSSVISKAKELNYTPRSYNSSEAVLNVQFPQSGLSVLTIPSGTSFSGKNANNTYVFTTNQSTILYPSGGYFTANNLPVYEGSYFTDSFVVDYTLNSQRYILSNPGIDTSSLSVVVSYNGSNTTYSYAPSLFGVTDNSNVYFLQATSNYQYEIVFGDGTFGTYPLNNSVVNVNYRVSSGTDGNGCSSFNLNTNLGPINGTSSSIPATITTISASFGGTNSESIESIRFNAPRYFQTQERAITTNDYQSLVLQNFPGIKNVHVYGGEDNLGNIQYGTVFLSPITYSGSNISSLEKSNIVNYLLDKCTLGITPTVVDPNFLYLFVNVIVKYDPTLTTNSVYNIQSNVSSAIQNYNSTTLTNFNTQFNLSQFQTMINGVDPSIITNDVSVTMMKSLNPLLNTLVNNNFSFNNAINSGTVSSSIFLSGGRQYKYTDYNPNNNTFTIIQTQNGIQINNSTNSIYIVDVTNPSYPSYQLAGVINYSTGAISLNQISINDFLSKSGVEFYATPTSPDVDAMFNDVIMINVSEGINITVTSTT